jgi:hypothetical protein
VLFVRTDGSGAPQPRAAERSPVSLDRASGFRDAAAELLGATVIALAALLMSSDLGGLVWLALIERIGGR